MTTILFFITFTSVFFVLLNFLPVSTGLPSEVVTGFQYIIGQMKAWNEIFPIDTLFTVVSIVTVYYGALWTWRAVLWVIHLIRGATQ